MKNFSKYYRKLKTANKFMTWDRFIVLEVVQKKLYTMTALSEELSISTAAVTGLIDSMVEQELVCRVADAKDRRKQIVKITKRGTIVYNTVVLEDDDESTGSESINFVEVSAPNSNH